MKSVNRVGLDIDDIVLEPLAASEAVLSRDERDLGVALVDIGGSSTNIAVFYEGSIKHTSVLPVGGYYVTSDIATGLRTPITEAEKIKLKFGCAYTPMIPKESTIEVPSVGGRGPREVSRQILGRIIEPRLEEILTMAHKEIIKSGFEDLLAAGIVLTGGTALLEGITELAERIFNMPVRRGYPTGIGGLTDVVNSPLFATGVGLVIYGSKNLSIQSRSGGNILTNLIAKIKNWILELF
jgi:cell division protein FtsA